MTNVDLAAPTELALPSLEAARAYAAAARAPRTREAYAAALAAFTNWCAVRAPGMPAVPCPSEAVAVYLAELASAGRRPNGIELVLVAISQAHRAAGHPSPREHAAVRAVRAGIRRTHGTAVREAAPLSVEQLRAVVASLPSSLVGIRDRALLLVGYAACLRRSELVALQVHDVTARPEGLAVRLAQSKTDQEGAGEVLGVPFGRSPATCPVRAWRAWLEASGVTEGSLFPGLTRWGALTGHPLAGRDVARIVKRAAAAAGIDPEALSGHSLRAGFITAAAKAGKHERDIMRQSRHRSPVMLRRYIRGATLFESNAAEGIGL